MRAFDDKITLFASGRDDGMGEWKIMYKEFYNLNSSI
jgi:hypothetical protein